MKKLLVLTKARPMIENQPARPSGSRAASLPAKRRAAWRPMNSAEPIPTAIRICSQWVWTHCVLAMTMPCVCSVSASVSMMGVAALDVFDME